MYSLHLQDSDDIRYMVGALKTLGIQLEERWEEGVMVVHGCGGRFPVEVGEPAVLASSYPTSIRVMH